MALSWLTSEMVYNDLLMPIKCFFVFYVRLIDNPHCISYVVYGANKIIL